jgi:hypothetical protein
MQRFWNSKCAAVGATRFVGTSCPWGFDDNLGRGTEAQGPAFSIVLEASRTSFGNILSSNRASRYKRSLAIGALARACKQNVHDNRRGTSMQFG